VQGLVRPCDGGGMAAPRVVLCAEEKAKWQREALARRSTAPSSAETPSLAASVLGWLLGPSFPASADDREGHPSSLSHETLILCSVAAFPDPQPPWTLGNGDADGVEALVGREVQALRSLLPGGISVVGCYCCCSSSSSAQGEAALQRASALASEVVSGLRGPGKPPAGKEASELILLQLDSEGGDIKGYACSSGGGRLLEASWALGERQAVGHLRGSHTLLSLSLAFHLPLYSSDKEGWCSRPSTTHLSPHQLRASAWLHVCLASSRTVHAPS